METRRGLRTEGSMSHMVRNSVWVTSITMPKQLMSLHDIRMTRIVVVFMSKGQEVTYGTI